MIGGPQGSGINASAEVFAKACSRAGLRVYANIEYHSNIMGKHSFYRVRVDDEDIRSSRDIADILVALDDETLSGDGIPVTFERNLGSRLNARVSRGYGNTPRSAPWVR